MKIVGSNDGSLIITELDKYESLDLRNGKELITVSMDEVGFTIKYNNEDITIKNGVVRIGNYTKEVLNRR